MLLLFNIKYGSSLNLNFP